MASAPHADAALHDSPSPLPTGIGGALLLALLILLGSFFAPDAHPAPAAAPTAAAEPFPFAAEPEDRDTAALRKARADLPDPRGGRAPGVSAVPCPGGRQDQARPGCRGPPAST